MTHTHLCNSLSPPPPHVLLQLVIMSGTALLAYYMECTDLFSVHVQGFFCNDADLMKPYPGSEDTSFVPPLVLYCVVAAAPTAIVSSDHHVQFLPIMLLWCHVWFSSFY